MSSARWPLRTKVCLACLPDRLHEAHWRVFVQTCSHWASTTSKRGTRTRRRCKSNLILPKPKCRLKSCRQNSSHASQHASHNALANTVHVHDTGRFRIESQPNGGPGRGRGAGISEQSTHHHHDHAANPLVQLGHPSRRLDNKWYYHRYCRSVGGGGGHCCRNRSLALAASGSLPPGQRLRP